jgi:hypothetical protein
MTLLTPHTDVDARVWSGVATVLAAGLAGFLTVTVALGVALGTSVVQDGRFTVALVGSWSAVAVGLFATRWLYATGRVGQLARLSGVAAVSLLVLTATTLFFEGAAIPAAVALLLAAILAWFTSRRGDEV